MLTMPFFFFFGASVVALRVNGSLWCIKLFAFLRLFPFLRSQSFFFLYVRMCFVIYAG